MEKRWLRILGGCMLLAFLVAVSGPGWAKEAVQQWELVNPAGVIKAQPVKFVLRPASLEGKTVILRWNAKPNGDILLNRIGELLVQNIKGVKVIKAWEVAPETRSISYGHVTSQAVAKKLASLKPDLVIGAPAD
jgi:hypothetical protein